MYMVDMLGWILIGLWWVAVLGLIVYLTILATRLVDAVTRIAEAMEGGGG